MKTEGMSSGPAWVLSLMSDTVEDNKDKAIKKLSTNGSVLSREEECGKEGRYINLKRLEKAFVKSGWYKNFIFFYNIPSDPMILPGHHVRI